MIRNIVFDLGNVLLSWRPFEFLTKHGYDEKTAGLMVGSVFRSSHWLRLDNGEITNEEAIELMTSDSTLTKEQISSLFDLCHEIIHPLPANVKLLPELKRAGFKLYYLSNFPTEFFGITKSRYEFFSHFDGGIISAEVGCSKPDPAIYNIFLERFRLKAEECLFIDDLEPNAGAGKAAGMKVIHLDGSYFLESKLQELQLI